MNFLGTILPAEGIGINRVNPATTGGTDSWTVTVNPTDTQISPGIVWGQGSTFVDPTNNISIQVNAIDTLRGTARVTIGTSALTSAPVAPTPTPGAGVLAANQWLEMNQQLLSPNGKTRLVMQNDGNLTLYRVDTGAVLWNTATGGTAATHLVMQADGNLVLYNSANSAAFWNSGTFGHPGASLMLGDDGNLLIVDPNGAQLWATNTRVP